MPISRILFKFPAALRRRTLSLANDRWRHAAKRLQRKFHHHDNTLYVDATKYDEETTALVVTTREGDILDCISMRHTITKNAETGDLLRTIR